MAESRTTVNPGVYLDMDARDYHAADGLSNSGIKDLVVSPLTYWDRHINPESLCARELCGERRADHPTEECKYFQRQAETPAMRLGTALHAAVLEPDRFLDRYNCAVSDADFPGCLDTIADLKAWIGEHGGSIKGPNKPDFVKEALRLDPNVPILAERLKQHAAANAGKVLLNKVDWEKVYGMSRALLREDALKPILARGKREVSIFAIDPQTGVLLKCRLDWFHESVLDGGTVCDLKTFSARDEPIDRTVMHAIRYGGYDRQAWLYVHIMKLAGIQNAKWINAFVQSDAPYEVRLRAMGPHTSQHGAYWKEAGAETRSLIRQYAKYREAFGSVWPWAYHKAIVPVDDSEVPGLGYRGKEKEDELYAVV